MKKIYKSKILLFSLMLIFLNGCQNFKDGLSFKKKANTDEFLVQKKNPLIFPPDYEDLPTPMGKQKVQNEKNNEIDLSQIFSNSEKNDSEKSSEINKSLEDSIRKKIETN